MSLLRVKIPRKEVGAALAWVRCPFAGERVGPVSGEVRAASLEEQVEGGAVLLWEVSDASMTK